MQCDNAQCDYIGEPIEYEQAESYIGTPCPKCGENILTQQDYDNLVTIIKGMDLINHITKDNPYNENEPKVLIGFDTHKGISINKIESVK